MATYTDNYQLTKPLYSEIADVSVINNNMDKIDDIMHNSQISLADAYDQTQTYELGEKVMYEMLLYRCVSRITTPEVWNPDHWERTTAADEGGNYVDVDEKFQTGLNVADIDVDGDQHSINVPYMTGATSQADGTAGLPPAPQEGDEGKFLKGDGTWGDVAGSAEDIDYDNTESGLVADDVQDAIDEVVSMIPSLPTVYGEVSGAVASFEDGTANPLEELVIGIEPVQAGTGDPSPSNPMPISGWSSVGVIQKAKNIMDLSGTDTANGYVPGRYINENNVEQTPSGSIEWNTSEYLMVPPNSTLTLSGLMTTSSSSPSICQYDNEKTFIKGTKYSNQASITFTTEEKTRYVRVSFATTQRDLMMLEVGSTATSFVPYNPHTSTTTTIQLGQTVYGGELDVTTGVLTVDKYYIDAFTDYGYGVSESGGLATISLNIPSYSLPTGVNGSNISNRFSKNIPSGNVGRMVFNGSIMYFVVNASELSEISSAGARGWFANNPTQVVYELATPTTIQLTPTQINSLLGANSIWADTGNVINCKYIRDLNLTINILWNAVFNQSNTRSLSLMKSVNNIEESDTKEVEEEETEKEVQKEIKKEGNTDENQR